MKQSEKVTTASGFQWETGGSGSIGAPSLSRSVLIFLTPRILNAFQKGVVTAHVHANRPTTLQPTHFSYFFLMTCSSLSFTKCIKEEQPAELPTQQHTQVPASR